MNNKFWKLAILIVLISVCTMLLYRYQNSRRYINFTYITESNYTNLDYFADYNFPNNDFTWWWHFPANEPMSNTNTIKVIDRMFGTTFENKLKEEINQSRYDIIISFGRKLKMIYYDRTINPNGKGAYSKKMIIAVPVFEKKYEHKIYLYITDKKYNIYPEEFSSDDIEQFNRYGNIRFNEE